MAGRHVDQVTGFARSVWLPAEAELDIFTHVQLSVAEGAGQQVESSPSALIDPDAAVDLAEMFRLLGDPTRVRILFALLNAGELCVRDIAAVVDTSETKVSQAMRLLRHAGVVRNRRDGRNIFYRLDDDHIQNLLQLSRDHLAHLDGTNL